MSTWEPDPPRDEPSSASESPPEPEARHAVEEQIADAVEHLAEARLAEESITGASSTEESSTDEPDVFAEDQLPDWLREPDETELAEDAIAMHADPVPAVARVVEASGCARYHAVGAEIEPPLYRRDGEACGQTSLDPPQRLLAVGAPIDLAPLQRTVEDVPDRRLQRIVLSDDQLRFADDRLFDEATRTECVRAAFGDVTRCIPASVATASALFAPGCAVEVRVAETPQRSCERIAFATAVTDEGMEIRAIGDRLPGPLYHVGGTGQCQPYASSPGNVLRALGPPIAPEAFVSAVSYGER